MIGRILWSEFSAQEIDYFAEELMEGFDFFRFRWEVAIGLTQR